LNDGDGFIAGWLKWDSDVIGTIDSANAVTFVRPAYNIVPI